MNLKRLIIVIPAYEPDYHLKELVTKLNTFFTDFDIIIVDDGSKNKDVFSDVKKISNVTLLTNDVNKGKGEALKVAFRHIRELDISSIIVTADSDGQHKPEDIKRIYDFYLEHENSLVLGSRQFENEVPKKSRFGNDVSRFLLRCCLNKHLNDTQTGLRAFSSSLLDFMINIKGNKFEYEMNMLSESIINDINVFELKIETIYIDENKGSHFRPIRDFFRIVGSILKYRIINYLTLLLDFGIFVLLFNLLKNKTEIYYIHSSIIASILALLMNLIFNNFNNLHGDKRIFNNKKKLLRKLILGIILIASNLGLLLLFNNFMNNLYLIRLITNIILFILLIPINYVTTKKNKVYGG